MPFAIARATDTVVAMVAGTGGSIATLVWLATALLALSLANSAISNLTGYWGDVMATRLRAILSRNYFGKLLRLPRRDYDQKAELWLAPDLGYVPVRIRLTQANGDFADLRLSSSGPP